MLERNFVKVNGVSGRSEVKTGTGQVEFFYDHSGSYVVKKIIERNPVNDYWFGVEIACLSDTKDLIYSAQDEKHCFIYQNFYAPHEGWVDLKDIVLSDYAKIKDKVDQALAILKGMGINHNDIKEDNIRFNVFTGEIKLIDYGYAYRSDTKQPANMLCAMSSKLYSKVTENFEELGPSFYANSQDSNVKNIKMIKFLTNESAKEKIGHTLFNQLRRVEKIVDFGSGISINRAQLIDKSHVFFVSKKFAAAALRDQFLSDTSFDVISSYTNRTFGEYSFNVDYVMPLSQELAGCLIDRIKEGQALGRQSVDALGPSNSSMHGEFRSLSSLELASSFDYLDVEMGCDMKSPDSFYIDSFSSSKGC